MYMVEKLEQQGEQEIQEYIFDRKTKRLIKNPLFIRQREKEMQQGVGLNFKGEVVSSEELFGIVLKDEEKYLKLDFEDLIGKTHISSIDERSLRNLEKSYQGLLSTLSTGNIPKWSLLYYFGKQANLTGVAYNIQSTAYRAGLKTMPVLTPFLISTLTSRQEYEQYIKADIIVILLPTGEKVYDIELVRGFLQQRSLYSKPTVVLLGGVDQEKYILINLCTLENPRYDLGLLNSVTYKEKLTPEKQVGMYHKALEVTKKTLDLDIDTSDIRFKGVETEEKILNKGRKKVKPLVTNTTSKEYEKLVSSKPKSRSKSLASMVDE